jgi:hypothetical protein
LVQQAQQCQRLVLSWHHQPPLRKLLGHGIPAAQHVEDAKIIIHPLFWRLKAREQDTAAAK